MIERAVAEERRKPVVHHISHLRLEERKVSGAIVLIFVRHTSPPLHCALPLTFLTLNAARDVSWHCQAEADPHFRPT